jgi:hypothetical protein
MKKENNMKQEYLTTEEWAKEFKLAELFEQQIRPSLKVFAPEVLNAIEHLPDEDLKDLERMLTISLRQWYMENTEE